MSEVKKLAIAGDPIERSGISYGLAEKFPNYAEFWATYVFPNRDESDSSKFRLGFPVELEAICNNHYSVFYHLTFAFRQIKFLREVSLQIDAPIDFSDPLIHLATAVDMVERTFVAVFQIKFQLEKKPLTSEEFQKKSAQFWEKKYKDRFKGWEQNLSPVSLKLHDITTIFEEYVTKGPTKSEFITVSGNVRQYRNIFAHTLSPLRVIKAGVVHLPKQSFLKDYRDGHWSSGRDSLNPDHFAPAIDVIEQLANNLVAAIDKLWEILLPIMAYIASLEKYVKEFRQELPEVDYNLLISQPHDQTFLNSMGSALYNPPLRPSGIHTFDNEDRSTL